MAKELVILQKVEDMAAYAYLCIEQFPKSHKFTIGERIQMLIQEIMQLIIACNKKYYKKTTFQEIDIHLEALRSFVRIAKSLKILPFHKYEHWASLNDEIGRMLGGWIKAMDVKALPEKS